MNDDKEKIEYLKEFFDNQIDDETINKLSPLINYILL